MQFLITDTGIGIAPETQSKLFDAFSQADDSITRRFGGTGLGLAICKRLAEAMGGTIEINSALEHGSTFTVQLPLRPGQAKPAVPSQEPLAGKRVLCVSANRALQDYLLHTLRGFGMHISAAFSDTDAHECMKAADAKLQPFDAVVIDQQLQEMQDYEFLLRLRVQSRYKTMRIMILSHHARPGDALRAQQHDANAFLALPARQREIHDTLRLMFGPQSPADSIVTRHTATEANAQHLERILVVEDNEVNQMVAVGFLRALGYPTDVAHNGVQALAALEQRRYDLVFMDMQMPELDGVEATRRWRANESPQTHLPIIAMTANTQDEDKSICLTAGMDDFISKPLSQDALRAVIERAFARRAPVRTTSI